MFKVIFLRPWFYRMLTIKIVLKIKKNFKNPLRKSRDTRNNLCHVIIVKDFKIFFFIFKTFLIVSMRYESDNYGSFTMSHKL